MKQNIALNVLKLGVNVFLTGPPGSGKTFVLNEYINYIKKHGKNLSVTASTGIAASHINGVTLHSFAGLGLDIEVNDKFIEKIFSKYYLVRRLKKVEILIIDEVSMVNPNVFCAVNKILKMIKESNDIFGGIQVVLSGDFFQLPPVNKGCIINTEKKYVWQTDIWQDLRLSVCYLHEKFRHEDEEFVSILEEIREGSVSKKTTNLLNKAKQILPENTKKIIKLYTHNIDIDRINNFELSKLKNDGRIFQSGTMGDELFIKNIFSSTLVVELLKIKVGAHVIFIKNNEEIGYINGTMGEVIEFDESGYPVVKVLDGRVIVAEPEEWIKETESGGFLAGVRQIPLRLAWAITIHKSQGMTLDEAVIDLSHAFEVGQGYVALSRIRTFSGLFLEGINSKALEVDRDVQIFDKKLIKKSKSIEIKLKNKDMKNIKRYHKKFISKINVVV